MFEGDFYTDMISYCSVLLFRVQREQETDVVLGSALVRETSVNLFDLQAGNAIYYISVRNRELKRRTFIQPVSSLMRTWFFVYGFA